ncbi:MAG: energy transducer TonB [Saprospiraceae bacterium]
MKKEKKDDSFIKQPYIKGGDKALKSFINDHLKYPAKSRINKIEGDVQVRFEINYKGEVTDTKIISGLDEDCNAEAMRVIKLLKYVVPKTPRGVKVTFHKSMNTLNKNTKYENCQVNKAKNKAHFSNSNYTITNQNAQNNGDKSSKGTTYQYTIKIN